jgi:Bacterial lectin
MSRFPPSRCTVLIALLSFLLGVVNAQTPVAAPVRTSEPTRTLSVTSINYGNGINCDAPLTLNMGGRAYPRLIPINKTCFLQMTTDDAVGRASSAFAQFRFLKVDNYDFTVRFDYRMFGPSQGIGDGLAFVMHHDRRGGAAVGGVGGNLGVYGATVISPAIVFEFDSGTCWDGPHHPKVPSFIHTFSSLLSLSHTHINTHTHIPPTMVLAQ